MLLRQYIIATVNRLTIIFFSTSPLCMLNYISVRSYLSKFAYFSGSFIVGHAGIVVKDDYLFQVYHTQQSRKIPSQIQVRRYICVKGSTPKHTPMSQIWVIQFNSILGTPTECWISEFLEILIPHFFRVDFKEKLKVGLRYALTMCSTTVSQTYWRSPSVSAL